MGCEEENTQWVSPKVSQKNLCIDYKSNRMWMGAKQSLESKLKNTAFLRTKVEFLDKVFAPNEISEIWITFPDPQIQKSRIKKRLTHPRFLNLYKKFLRPQGIIHLKTDNTIFFEYTLEVLRELGLPILYHTFDLHQQDIPKEYDEIRQIQTYYEQLFSAQGHTIKYCQFQLN
jgi:Predicted S-adenosylmethionine-dependent methyltransferase